MNRCSDGGLRDGEKGGGYEYGLASSRKKRTRIKQNIYTRTSGVHRGVHRRTAAVTDTEMLFNSTAMILLCQGKPSSLGVHSQCLNTFASRVGHPARRNDARLVLSEGTMPDWSIGEGDWRQTQFRINLFVCILV